MQESVGCFQGYSVLSYSRSIHYFSSATDCSLRLCSLCRVARRKGKLQVFALYFKSSFIVPYEPVQLWDCRQTGEGVGVLQVEAAALGQT